MGYAGHGVSSESSRSDRTIIVSTVLYIHKCCLLFGWNDRHGRWPGVRSADPNNQMKDPAAGTLGSLLYDI